MYFEWMQHQMKERLDHSIVLVRLPPLPPRPPPQWLRNITHDEVISNDALGTTEVQTLNPQEGPIVSVQHCDFSNQSLVVYATEEGFFHAWDLRAKREAWTMKNKVSFAPWSS